MWAMPFIGGGLVGAVTGAGSCGRRRGRVLRSGKAGEARGQRDQRKAAERAAWG